MRYKILIVDDENNILEALKRLLHYSYEVHTITEPLTALKLLNDDPDFATVISDYKMPQMNGVEFLSKVKIISPNTTRILLTGYADIRTAIMAVNESNIFNLLTKPINNEIFLKSLETAIRQYELINAEKVLLEKTLKGSLKVLIDIISLVNQDLFRQANMMRKMAKEMAEILGLENLWEIEIAALLSQIGCVAIPGDLFIKWRSGFELDDNEKNMIDKYPEIGGNLIKNIPRLNDVGDIIINQNSNFDIVEKRINEGLITGAKILRVLNAYFQLTNSSIETEEAVKLLKGQPDIYDKDVVIALNLAYTGQYKGLRILKVYLRELKEGDVLADDIVNSSGVKLLKIGSEITSIAKLKLINCDLICPIIEPISIFSRHN